MPLDIALFFYENNWIEVITQAASQQVSKSASQQVSKSASQQVSNIHHYSAEIEFPPEWRPVSILVDLNATSFSRCSPLFETLSKRGLLNCTIITCLPQYSPLATYLSVSFGSIPVYIVPIELSDLAAAIVEKSTFIAEGIGQRTSNLDRLTADKIQIKGELNLQKTTLENSRPSLSTMRTTNEGERVSIVETELGHAARKLILHQKIELAKTEIAQGRSIKIVALDLGFKDLAYFSNVFSKYVGMSPRTYATHFFSFDGQLRSSSDNR